MYYFVFLLSLTCVCDGLAELASFITPCRLSDPACLKSSTQKAIPFLAAGVPELGVHKMDPMLVDRVQASQAGLNMDFTNTAVKGLKKCEVLNMKRDGMKMLLAMKCSVTLLGHYVLGGKLLVFPIDGNGRYRIDIRDIIVKIWFDVEETDVSGVKHWTITKWKQNSEVKTGAKFRFENLFHGDKQLSDAIHNFANSNWKEIFQEVAPPIVKAVISRIVDEVKNLFRKVPINQLVIN